jgi:hypothetical protein
MIRTFPGDTPMAHDRTPFAFRLADRSTQETRHPQAQWQPRDGIAIAGCTDPKANGILREAFPWGDGRAYC